jgi:hypothetical protein
LSRRLSLSKSPFHFVAPPELVEGELVFFPVSEPVEDTDSFLGYCV